MPKLKKVCWGCCFFACIITFMVMGILLPATASGCVESLSSPLLRLTASVGLIFALVGVLHVANCCGERLTEALES